MAATSKGALYLQRIIILSVIITVSYASKLNVPKLLLPYYSTVATNFTLEVSQGCFTWQSTRPEIALVHPEGAQDASSCSQKAVVSAVSRVPTRKTAIVTAENSATGQKLRCDVIVDDIENIEIETTTKELYLDDSPEQFEIRAINEEGDVFSSLEGVTFAWNLLTDAETGQEAHTVLRFLKFSESNYKAPIYIKELEEQGRRGDRILVRGIRTGSAKVSVKVADPVYKQVKEAVVRIVVIANIQLNPPLVYLLQHTTVTYKVELLKQQTIQEIQMPSEQYFLQLEDTAIASLDPRSSTVTALEFGDTEVKLKDKNIKLKGTFREPNAAIYVVKPGYLDFDVFPGRNWVLQTDTVYEIYVNVYDKESHKIFASDNIRVQAEFPDTYFKVLSSSKNGTYHVVRTLKRGFTTIEGQLRAVLHVDGTEHEIVPVIEGSQDVDIYDPVTVLPKELVLPWDVMATAIYQYQLNATGGSGNYTWLSEKPTVAVVSMRGVVTSANTIGVTVVTVADARNAAHFDTMTVRVLPPGEMEFLPSRVEAELDTLLTLPLAVYGKQDGRRYRFDLCHLIPFVTEVTDATIFEFKEVMKPEAIGSCAGVQVKGQNIGHTEVQAQYRYKEKKPQATVTIAAYKPLKPIDPEELAVVTPAASKEIVFEGGPQPWVLDASKYYQTVTAEQQELLKMSPIKAYESRKTLHVFHVTCLQLGEQEIRLDVGNKPSAKNQFPASATASIRFACAEPKGLRLIPDVTHPTGLPPCPVSLEFDDPVPVHAYRDLRMLVTVTDIQGRKFDNFSSLTIEWTLDDRLLGSFLGEESVTTQLTQLPSGRRAATSYKEIGMEGQTGLLTVSAAIRSYNPEYFNSWLEQLTLTSPIEKSRVLDLVHDAVILPEYLTIYNQGTSRGSLKLQHGSGHFHLEHTNQGLATVDYDRKNRGIAITPVTEGTFKVNAFDLCLETTDPARATVFVSDVYQISLQVVDKVELSKEIEARVQVMDRNNQAIPREYFPLMNLQSKIGSDIIVLRPSTDKDAGDELTAVYIVKGASLGRTTLQFVAKQKSGKMVSSQPREIQVFPPLRLEPRNITLIIGALFQVTAHGGPQPESTIEFSIVEEQVATVSGSGLVDSQALGVTRLVGKAVGMDPQSGHVVYSQDEVTVNVVQLEGIRIYTPLKRLQTDTQMPIYAMGVNENEGPFSFGSALPPLSFQWSISNKDVAKLRPLFYKSRIQPSSDNNFAVRFFAEEPGHVTVRLTVTAEPGSRLQLKNTIEFADTVQIQVFEKLAVIKPEVCDGVFIMTPNTETMIKTNRDGSTAKITYSVLDHDAMTTNKDPVVMVAESGHVIAGSRSGKASLLIRSHEDTGVNQSVVVLIKVKPVSYLMINADTVIHTRGPRVTAVPLGTTLHFTVTFHDNVGQMFYATDSKIKYRPNRFDLLQIAYGTDNNTLVARATNIGQTVLKVWDKRSTQLADYVMIHVTSAITPAQAKVTLGDVVCFNSPVVTETDQSGSWYSSSNVLQIEQSTGIGLASQVGTSLVSYRVSPTAVTQTEVTVVPVTRVILRNDQLQYLSNVKAKNHVNVVTVTLEGVDDVTDDSIIGSNCSAVLGAAQYQVWRLPFRCEATLGSGHPQILVEDLIRVTAEYEPRTGQYQCRLQESTPHELQQAVSTLDTTVQLRGVVPGVGEDQPEVTSNVLSLPLLPAFYLHTVEVQLTTLAPLANLRMSATDRVLGDVKVTSSDDSLIRVMPAVKAAQSDYAVHYPIALQLTSGLWERNQLDASIEVRCISTGQKQTVPIRIKLLGDQAAQAALSLTWGQQVLLLLGNNHSTILLIVVCFVVTVFSILIAYYALLWPRYQAAANQSGVFLSPGAQQQQTPMPTSPWSPFNTSQSPQRLWSVDYGPYDSSGVFKRSPVPQRQSPSNTSKVFQTSH